MTAPAPGSIRFCFDYLSPYAYLAWTQVHAVAARHGRAVEPWPILFAAVLNETGQRGPAELPSERVYVFKDALRTARLVGVPLQPPPRHPFNPLLALRVSALPLEPAARKLLLDELYRRAWAGGGGVDGEESVAAAITAVGLDAPAVLAAAVTPENKQRLKENTATALADGVFGVPGMLVDGELYFGFHGGMTHLENHLSGKDPLRGMDLRGFASLPAGAVRPQSRT